MPRPFPFLAAAAAAVLAGGVALHAPHNSPALELLGVAFLAAGVIAAGTLAFLAITDPQA